MAILVDKSLDIPEYPIWRLTVGQYHDMIQAGILTEDDPVELLEGLLVTKLRKTPAHTFATHTTREAIEQLVPSGWYVGAHEPITTTDSEPEPDVIVIRGSPRDYPDSHPSPSDVALVVEVSDATLQRDRTLKLTVYANARITTYWILNLQERQLEAYSDPADATYRQRDIYGESDSVPVVIDGQEVGRISVRELLP
jgi:Uma2 family endonuclease